MRLHAFTPIPLIPLLPLILGLTATPAGADPRTLLDFAGRLPAPLKAPRTALIVIDAQREYTTGRLPLSRIRSALDSGEKALRIARASGWTVIHVLQDGRQGGLFDPDSPFALPIPGFEPAPGESVVHKKLPNSFAGTDLLQRLREARIESVVLIGFMTHMCVEATARAGLDLGLDVRVLSDATATRNLLTPGRRGILPARTIQQASLAALFDRFAFPITLEELRAAAR